MKYLFIVFFLFGTLQAQSIFKGSFNLAAESDNPFSGYLYGNGIVDLIAKDSTLWAATGYALNQTTDGGNYWQAFTSAHYIGKGGVSAMGFMDDSTLWIAAAFDTFAMEKHWPAGGGLSYTRDNGKTWTHVPQPVDSRDEEEYSPTTTVVQNLTYDIAFLDSTIWITSWAGGLRRSDDMGETWRVVTTDGKPFNVINIDYGLNHMGFSVLSENGNLWVGSAAGISKSTDNGQTWQKFNYKNQEYPISGDFVVSLDYQEYNNTIWAAAKETCEYDKRGVCKTSNGGLTWKVVLPDVFAHNFAFDGPRIYVAADEGLFVSEDDGKNWYKIPHIRDHLTGEEILTNEFYSAEVQNINGDKILWLGSADGLAVTSDNGNTWSVIRSLKSTKIRKEPKVYAYPSPFSPSRHSFIRFQYDITGSSEVEIKIYDFAMDYVATIRDSETFHSAANSDRSAKWDGRTDAGNVVASGVYYFRAKINDRVTWGKLVVIN
jgi:photosystem II stability/assembly factor-like uncharacterized protein